MAKIAPPASRATPPLLKYLNERTILETIRTAAPISRAEISRRAGISKPTVSLALQALVEAGLFDGGSQQDAAVGARDDVNVRGAHDMLNQRSMVRCFA